ncbi:hypothetical protein [Oceanimonas baumannii]|uniref:EamA domain-containing protein n=1 Tax=Oceanimonas baumannii TaxID=129578 RepID=A0A235CGV3_9GAMM|nr:hypothetical protein [Oceanimonas baumannii]OYD23614.1 hypothetical protein B6S09_11780 [Oceanimonas baumannii]TDW56843.1 hypothetical protein LY04_02855 [Oceanimonas baumannii]
MSPLALLLVLCSAALHALWNLLGKRASPGYAFFWLANLTQCLLLPVLSLRQWRPGQYLTPGCALALLAAVGTSGYSLIDAHAITLLRDWLEGLHGQQSLALYYLWLQVMAVLVTLCRCCCGLGFVPAWCRLPAARPGRACSPAS